MTEVLDSIGKEEMAMVFLEELRDAKVCMEKETAKSTNM